MLNSKLAAVVAHQNLLEFYCVITNPRQIENPLSTRDALNYLEIYLYSSIPKIYPSLATLPETLKLAKHLHLTKSEIFDCYLAVTMYENNVSTIYTLNIAHFKRYPFLKAINPFE